MKKMKETLQLSVSWCASASQLLNLFYVNLRLNFLVCLAVATHGYFTNLLYIKSTLWGHQKLEKSLENPTKNRNIWPSINLVRQLLPFDLYNSWLTSEFNIITHQYPTWSSHRTPSISCLANKSQRSKSSKPKKDTNSLRVLTNAVVYAFAFSAGWPAGRPTNLLQVQQHMSG
jgi:hypothetical protein